MSIPSDTGDKRLRALSDGNEIPALVLGVAGAKRSARLASPLDRV